MEIIDENKTLFLVGENAQDNWDIIKKAENNWLWFHLHNLSSGHVIICKDSAIITNEEKTFAGTLCKSNTKYKSMKDVSVVYCEINNLVIGEEVGSVYFKNNKKANKIII